MKLPINCPSCSEKLQVSKMVCKSCNTEVSGRYVLPVLMQLSPDDQEFLMQFFLASGSLKEMAAKTAKSYPTVRNKLDDLIEKIQSLSNET